jgi:hypothetical protein
MDTDSLIESETPPSPRKLAAHAIAAAEEACLAEMKQVLERYGCKLVAMPERVGDLWALRVAVRYRHD